MNYMQKMALLSVLLVVSVPAYALFGFGNSDKSADFQKRLNQISAKLWPKNNLIKPLDPTQKKAYEKLISDIQTYLKSFENKKQSKQPSWLVAAQSHMDNVYFAAINLFNVYAGFPPRPSMQTQYAYLYRYAEGMHDLTMEMIRANNQKVANILNVVTNMLQDVVAQSYVLSK